MTAETGMTDRQKLKFLARFAALYAVACALVHKGKRTDLDVRVLLQALQAFKEGKLGGVILKRKTLDEEQILQVCSMLVTDLPFKVKDHTYLRQRGIRYVGELFYVQTDRRSGPSRETRERLMGMLEERYGLTEELDPLSMGWEPVYWSDPSFLDALSTPVVSVLGEEIESLWVEDHKPRRLRKNCLTMARIAHRDGIHYLGQFIQVHVRFSRRVKRVDRPQRLSPGMLKHIQRQLNQAGVSQLWAGALVPPTWQPAQEVPDAWVAQEQLMREQEEELARLRREIAVRKQATLEWIDTHQRRHDAWLAGRDNGDVFDNKHVDWLRTPIRELPFDDDELLDGIEHLGIQTLGQLVQLTGQGFYFLLQSAAGGSCSDERRTNFIVHVLHANGLPLFTVLPEELRETFELPEAFLTQVRSTRCTPSFVERYPELMRHTDELEVSVRTANCLQQANLHRMWQLVIMTEAGLLKIERFGRKNLKEIKDLLASMDLHLGMELDPGFVAEAEGLLSTSET